MAGNTSVLEAMVQTVWHASWQASAFALVVVAVVSLLRRRLSPAGRYSLWALVLVRLLLPFAPPARWSPFNVPRWLSSPVAVVEPAARRSADPPRSDPFPVRTEEARAAEPARAVAPVSEAATVRARTPVPAPPVPMPMTVRQLASRVWLLGVVVMSVVMARRIGRLRRSMRTWRRVADPEVLELLDECAHRLGVDGRVRLEVAPDVRGPAVVGVLGPRIVLPESVLAGFGRDQLEVILLHELAHVRRRDPAVHLLMMTARLLHWFNPIAWFALARMAAERENACDDVVIDALGRTCRKLYGETILHLVETLAEAPMVPGVVRFFGSRRRLRARLESIVRETRPTARGRRLATWLVLLLGLLGLTDAVSPSRPARGDHPRPARAQSLAPAGVDEAKSEPATEPAEVRVVGPDGRFSTPRVPPGRGSDFEFRISADGAKRLSFASSHPELVRFFEVGPVAASDLREGVRGVDLPPPATVEILLKPGMGANGFFLGASGRYTVLPVLPDSQSGPVVASGPLTGPTWQATVPALAPGTYRVSADTEPRAGDAKLSARPARTGRYRAMKEVRLKAGERRSVVFEPPVLHQHVWRGDRSATITIRPFGRPMLGLEEYEVWYTQGRLGDLPVARGTLGPTGQIVLEKIAPSGGDPARGHYGVSVGGEYLGNFRVEDQPARQSFSFRMPPRAGDLAPETTVQDPASGRPVRLGDFRGRIVFVEFWATWSGPCQPAVQTLVETARSRAESWRDDVILVAVSIDPDPEPLRRAIQQQGASPLRHLWSPGSLSDPGESASRAYAVHAVPTAFLVGRDGTIVWRGHPQEIHLEQRIEELRARERP